MLAGATAGMLAGSEPFATWYYPFAWYSTLLVMDAAVAMRGGRFFLLDQPGLAFSLCAWSIPFWLFFELLNFRLANWYYVFVPHEAIARWAGIGVSFATVLPAIFLAERALRGGGVERHPPQIAGLLPKRLLAGLQILGVLCIALPLLWPRLCFPLVWAGVTLVADPWVYRRDPGRSLLADLEAGRPGRPVRLLVGGMAIGLLWELFNFGARGKWVYTVPGLEDLKLFEMPVLGFFGFPFLALEGWSAYQALVAAGVAADSERADHRPVWRAGRRAVMAGILAALFCIAVLWRMEVETISSTTPRMVELPGVPSEAISGAGYEDVFDLAGADPVEVAEAAGVDPRRAQEWVAAARLATLRGIGTRNTARLRAAGIATAADLARADLFRLSRRLEQSGPPIPAARLRVWVRAAREEK